MADKIRCAYCNAICIGAENIGCPYCGSLQRDSVREIDITDEMIKKLQALPQPPDDIYDPCPHCHNSMFPGPHKCYEHDPFCLVCGSKRI